MVQLIINSNKIEVPDGTSVLKAATLAGYDVPALCHNDELEHINSCMLCLVKDQSTGRILPSCSAKVQQGMQIITDDEELSDLRKTGLELLLSDHVGDCEAPCQLGCPAHMNIPEMNRLIASGKFEESLKIVKRDISLPAVLGRICPAPCEGACHRKTVDEAVSICFLKRFVADEHNVNPWPVPPLSGKRVAVIGAGPAGLSAAYYLRLNGVEPTLFDISDKPGGLLRTAISDEKLPKVVLDREIQTIIDCGVNFTGNTIVDNDFFSRLKENYNAVIVATGTLNDLSKSFQLAGTPNGLEVNKKTFETSEKGVFAVGNVLRSSRIAIRSLGQGKDVAYSVLQYIQGQYLVGEPRLFNSRFGKLIQTEFAEYLKESISVTRMLEDKNGNGLTKEQAMQEASRCLRCDCRAINNCQLRNWSDYYGAVQKRFNTSPRRTVKKHIHNTGVVYEPEKCIKCGICVKLTEKYSEEYGLTFIGRGFDVAVGVPYGRNLDKGLQKIALKVADACPTGALEPHDRKNG